MRSAILIVLTVLLAHGSIQAAPVHEAARQGDVDRLQQLVQADPAVLDQTDSKGQSPLHHAVIGNKTAAAIWLLESGADPDQKSRSGQTPLFIAMDRGRNRVARLLLEGGADYRSLGSRAMAMAVRSGSSSTVSLLIQKGAPLDNADREGKTPLIMAARRGDAQSAGLLLQAGANPDVMMAEGVPLVCWAAAQGRKAMVEQLLTGGVDLSVRDGEGRNALDLAAAHGNSQVVQLLAGNGMSSTAGANTQDAKHWLAKPLSQGQAQLWHLGHCGWVVRTQNNLLVFDYMPAQVKPEHPGLSNGFLNPEELRGQKVTVFVTHGHMDHFSPDIFNLKEVGATFVYGFEPGTPGCGSERRYTGPEYLFTPPRSSHQLAGMTIETIESNDLGVGFVVSVDGVTLYHAGDHAGWRDGEQLGYEKEINHIASLNLPIDVAFLNVTGCHAHGPCPLADGTSYTLNKLQPKGWFPTHAGNREYEYQAFAARIAGQNNPSAMEIPFYQGEFWVLEEGRLVRP